MGDRASPLWMCNNVIEANSNWRIFQLLLQLVTNINIWKVPCCCLKLWFSQIFTRKPRVFEGLRLHTFCTWLTTTYSQKKKCQVIRGLAVSCYLNGQHGLFQLSCFVFFSPTFAETFSLELNLSLNVHSEMSASKWEQIRREWSLTKTLYILYIWCSFLISSLSNQHKTVNPFVDVGYKLFLCFSSCVYFWSSCSAPIRLISSRTRAHPCSPLLPPTEHSGTFCKSTLRFVAYREPDRDSLLSASARLW